MRVLNPTLFFNEIKIIFIFNSVIVGGSFKFFSFYVSLHIFKFWCLLIQKVLESLTEEHVDSYISKSSPQILGSTIWLLKNCNYKLAMAENNSAFGMNICIPQFYHITAFTAAMCWIMPQSLWQKNYYVPCIQLYCMPGIVLSTRIFLQPILTTIIWSNQYYFYPLYERKCWV